MCTAEAVRAQHEPPPLYSSTVCGVLEHKEFGRLNIQYGLTRELIAQLTQKSLDLTDDELHRHTSDYLRFGVGSYEEWYAKGRHPFALTNKEQELAALVWFGPSTSPACIDSDVPPQLWDTIAFRAYAPFRGRGLIKRFSEKVLSVHDALYPERPIWLHTRNGNVVAQSLYENLGFVVRGSDDTNTMMTRGPQRVDSCFT